MLIFDFKILLVFLSLSRILKVMLGSILIKWKHDANMIISDEMMEEI